jgi:hypothetical protein
MGPSGTPEGSPIVHVGLGTLDGGQLVLDLPQPGEIGLIVLFSERALGSPKFAM